MKPYIAIIKDSFHSARASKLFWAVIACSTLLLLALAPFGYKEATGEFTYGTFSEGLKFSRESGLQLIVAFIINWLLGVIALMVALLVTASFIPETFAEGSIDLLLSKPINRPALFLAKFAGGCCFYFVNMLYLIGGIFLLLGLRFSYWEPRLLICVLLSLFLFIVYYSISSLAGLLWKNSIVCIVLTMVFWGSCKTVEVGKALFEELAFDPISKVIKTDDQLIAQNRSGVYRIWDKASEKWKNISPHDSSSMGMMGPNIYAEGEQLCYSSKEQALYLLDKHNKTLQVAKASTDWQFDETTFETPVGLHAIGLDAQQRLILVCTTGISRIEAASVKLVADFTKIEQVDKFQEYEFIIANVDAQSGVAYMISKKWLYVFKPQAEGYGLHKKVAHGFRMVDGLKTVAADGLLMISEMQTSLKIYDADLEIKKEIPLNFKSVVSLKASHGRVAMLMDDKKLLIADTKTLDFEQASLPSQGEITAFEMSEKGIWLGEDRINIQQYDNEFNEQETYSASLSGAQKVYHYAIIPFYKVFPKPARLDDLMQHILTKEDDKTKATLKSSVWQPFWSTLAFVICILSFSCFYVSRKDY